MIILPQRIIYLTTLGILISNEYLTHYRQDLLLNLMIPFDTYLYTACPAFLAPEYKPVNPEALY